MSRKFSGLPDKQEKFCKEYLLDLNASEAARRAGYSAKNARFQASRLIDKPEIKERIQALMDERGERLKISVDDVLREILLIAKTDVNDIFGADGKLLPVNEIPENTRRAIAGIDVYKDFTEGVEIGETKKIKFWDKLKALELLGRHLKLFDPNVQNNTQVNVAINMNEVVARELDKIDDGRWED